MSASEAAAHHFVLSVCHRVVDPQTTASWLVSELDFWSGEVFPDGAVVENGALSLRLLLCADRAESVRPLRLEVVCRDLAASSHRLTSFPGVASLAAARQVSSNRLEQRLKTPFGIELVLARTLDEDELGIKPPLEKNILWREAAEELVRETMRCVPLAFRADARAKAIARAEYLAGLEGSIEVEAEQAIRALIETTPEFKRDDLQRSLISQGVDLRSLTMVLPKT